MKHYVYLITNLINGKQYVGDRSCNCEIEKDNYLGSGAYLKKAKEKYGNENFKKIILEEFYSKEEAFNAQEKYILQYGTLTPNGYNISSKGGHQVKNSISQETKVKMRNLKLGKKRKPFSELHKQRIGQSLNRKGNHHTKHSEESKKQISESNKGKKHCAEAKIKIGIGNKKPWEEKMGTEKANIRKKIYAENFKANKISFKEIDLNLALKLLNEGKYFKDVAKILNICTTTFNYKFRKIYNMTPYEYSQSLK